MMESACQVSKVYRLYLSLRGVPCGSDGGVSGLGGHGVRAATLVGSLCLCIPISCKYGSLPVAAGASRCSFVYVLVV